MHCYCCSWFFVRRHEKQDSSELPYLINRQLLHVGQVGELVADRRAVDALSAHMDLRVSGSHKDNKQNITEDMLVAAVAPAVSLNSSMLLGDYQFPQLQAGKPEDANVEREGDLPPGEE